MDKRVTFLMVMDGVSNQMSSPKTSTLWDGGENETATRPFG
jgi:hypothetical protein